MFKKDDNAVSPVIGVILMVAITVILAAVVAAFGFGFGGVRQKGPTAALTVENFGETAGIVDMKIQHKGGDTLKSGDWRISIVKSGDPPAYKISSSDFSAGDQIITHNLTSGDGTYIVNNRTIYSTGTSGTLAAETKYDVKIIVYPFETQVLDAVVSLR